MGMFNVDKLPSLKLTKALKNHTGEITKVYSENRSRWLLISMFPSTSKSAIRKMFENHNFSEETNR